MRADNKKALYRKVNTTARGAPHHHGNDYKNSRSKMSAIGMRKGVQRGLDYTPLFRFLLSKVGGNWSDIHSEAVSRLDTQDPIFFIVSMDYDSAEEAVRVGESSYFSGLFIDDAGILRVVNPELDENSLEPQCKCCTHTFNGIVFTRKLD